MITCPAEAPQGTAGPTGGRPRALTMPPLFTTLTPETGPKRQLAVGVLARPARREKGTPPMTLANPATLPAGTEVPA